MDEIQEIISILNLKPHPEGGFYNETYRSEGDIPKQVLGDHYSGARNYATGIYFLIPSESFSAFHRIKQDEMWHFYKGAAMNLHMISHKGDYSVIRIGNNLQLGEFPQFTVPGGTWFASEVSKPNGYSLMGCTVAPGFDFDDFEMPTRSELIELYPQHKAVIKKLTHN